MPPPPPPPPEAPAPTLPGVLLEEIFLRLPPDEPAWLVRSSLASKEWLGVLTGPAFRGRYREFHGAPPMLGFFHSSSSDSSGPLFASTAKFGPAVEGWIGSHNDYAVWDCRHGRVLLWNKAIFPFMLVAWDPMTGRQRELRAPEGYDSYVAAVLCNVRGCDHLACHEGTFSVVFLGLEHDDDGCVAYVYVSLPEAQVSSAEAAEWVWSKRRCALDLAATAASIVDRPPVYTQDALYFLITYQIVGDHSTDEDILVFTEGIFILKYDLGSHCLTMIDAPTMETDPARDSILMAMEDAGLGQPMKLGPVGDYILVAMEDGGLGFARLIGLTLYLWSRQMGSDGVPAWTQPRVMDVKNILPIQNLKGRVRLIGSVEGRDIIFVTTDHGTYEISLNSLRCKKIWKRDTFLNLVPYTSFYKQEDTLKMTKLEASRIV